MVNKTKLQRRHDGLCYAAIILAVIAAAFAPHSANADDGAVKEIILSEEQGAVEAAAKDDESVLERDHFLIRKSVERGRLLLESERYAEAKAEMDWVLRVNPGNPDAQEILTAALDGLAGRAVVEERRETEDVLLRNRLEMEYRYVLANRCIAEGRYAEAIPALQMAVAIGETIPDAQRLLDDSRSLLEKAQQHRNARMTEEAVRQREEAERLVRLYDQQQLEREEQRKAALLADAEAYRERRNYTSALAAVEELLKLEPGHQQAASLKNRIETEGREALASARAQERSLSYEREFSRIDEERLPQTALLRMPDGAGSARTQQTPASRQAEKDPSMETIERALSTPLSVNFEAATLRDSVSYLRRMTGCNMVIDNRTVRQDDPAVNLSIRNTEMVHILNSICRTQRLRWTVKDEAIIISDREITEEPVMRVYDITDLLVEPKDFYSGSFKTMYQGVDPYATDARTNIVKYDEKVLEEQNRRGEEWVAMLRDAVDPWSWAGEDGRGQNSIQYRAGKIVVTHDPETHTKIMRLLDAFRKARAVQVSIQARFLTVSKDHLERAGIDWTGLDNTETRGISENAQNIGAIRRSGAAYLGDDRRDEFGIPVTRAPWYSTEDLTNPVLPVFNPTRGIDERLPWPVLDAEGSRPSGLIDLRGASNMINSVVFPAAGDAWNALGGLFLDIAFLDRYQVRAIIEAVEKHRMGTILTAPRVTCFNGQRANIVVANLHNYIQTYDEDGTPTIQSVTDGVVFEVKPFVSADHRYVTLELLPSITELVAFETISITRTITTDAWGISGSLIIELPEVMTRAVETTVSVPDGGTIIIGGLSSANESEGYTSVPLLAKIPLIKYLFMSWGKIDTRESLVILVTADILIQTELEPAVAQIE